MFVVLTIRYHSDSEHILNLRRWLNRSEASSKKGVQTDISYLSTRLQSGVAFDLRQRGQRVKGGRKLAELRKILQALENPATVKAEWKDMRFGELWRSVGNYV